MNNACRKIKGSYDVAEKTVLVLRRLVSHKKWSNAGYDDVYSYTIFYIDLIVYSIKIKKTTQVFNLLWTMCNLSYFTINVKARYYLPPL